MRFVCVSDTHCKLGEMQVPEGDVLLHAGDATWKGTVQEISKFNEDLKKLPHKHKIVIAGNHDFLFEKDPALAKSLMTSCTYLHDESVVIGGIKIYGSPYQPWFYDWAFNLRRGEPLRKKWEQIPEDTDVLITHGPPWGHADVVHEGLGGSWEGGKDFRYVKKHVGCRDLMDRINVIKPKYHIFGHIHRWNGQTKNEHGTVFINASICNEDYDPIQPAQVFDL